MKHIKARPIKYKLEDLWEKIRDKAADIVSKFDENQAQSDAFRSGEYCDERKVFLHEIRLLKALLCIDLICTLTMAFIMVGM